MEGIKRKKEKEKVSISQRRHSLIMELDDAREEARKRRSDALFKWHGLDCASDFGLAVAN